MKNIYEVLWELDIDYKKYEHRAVVNVEEADVVQKELDILG